MILVRLLQLLGAVMLEFWGALSMCLIIVWRSLSIALSAPTICLLTSAYCIPVRCLSPAPCHLRALVFGLVLAFFFCPAKAVLVAVQYSHCVLSP